MTVRMQGAMGIRGRTGVAICMSSSRFRLEFVFSPGSPFSARSIADVKFIFSRQYLASTAALVLTLVLIETITVRLVAWIEGMAAVTSENRTRRGHAIHYSNFLVLRSSCSPNALRFGFTLMHANGGRRLGDEIEFLNDEKVRVATGTRRAVSRVRTFSRREPQPTNDGPGRASALSTTTTTNGAVAAHPSASFSSPILFHQEPGALVHSFFPPHHSPILTFSTAPESARRKLLDNLYFLED